MINDMFREVEKWTSNAGTTFHYLHRIVKLLAYKKQMSVALMLIHDMLSIEH